MVHAVEFECASITDISIADQIVDYCNANGISKDDIISINYQLVKSESISALSLINDRFALLVYDK